MQVLYSTQKHQLAAQAILIEEAMGKAVPYGYLKFLLDGKLVKVEITEDLKNEVKSILTALQKILTEEHIPEPTKYKKRCVDCCFWNNCKRI